MKISSFRSLSSFILNLARKTIPSAKLACDLTSSDFKLLSTSFTVHTAGTTFPHYTIVCTAVSTRLFHLHYPTLWHTRILVLDAFFFVNVM